MKIMRGLRSLKPFLGMDINKYYLGLLLHICMAKIAKKQGKKNSVKKKEREKTSQADVLTLS